uniref:F-box domain-containing protein n=1 Tax=Aegilops tauschii subsp. strangulata TaxID=200361 RepID=A0A453QEJ2_AEGTS
GLGRAGVKTEGDIDLEKKRKTDLDRTASLPIAELEETAARMEAPPREIDAHPPSSAPATASSSSSPTEHAAMRIWAKRTRYASASSVFAASRPRGWAELPEDFLQSLVTRLGSFRDLLAFGATCRPWRDLLNARGDCLIRGDW